MAVLYSLILWYVRRITDCEIKGTGYEKLFNDCLCVAYDGTLCWCMAITCSRGSNKHINDRHLVMFKLQSSIAFRPLVAEWSWRALDVARGPILAITQARVNYCALIWRRLHCLSDRRVPITPGLVHAYANLRSYIVPPAITHIGAMEKPSFPIQVILLF